MTKEEIEKEAEIRYPEDLYYVESEGGFSGEANFVDEWRDSNKLERDRFIEGAEWQQSSMQKKIDTLREDNKKLKIEASNYAYQADIAKRERDAAEAHVARLLMEVSDLKIRISLD